jgi:uncharacterized protein (DUF488 family)
VALVVDVRLNAVSRRPGFSKNRLRDRLEDAGIRYEHERALGNPRENRPAFHAGELDEAWAGFYAALGGDGEDALGRLSERIETTRVAIMCVESDPRRCHRACVVHRLRERTGTRVVDL